jgi:four helix bundle protein
MHLNLAEGCGRKTPADRRRFYEIARCSLIEVEAAFEIAVELQYKSESELFELGELIIRGFSMISKMMR